VNAPAKTGLPGEVKPANYLGFVEFAIRVFDAFHVRGWQRYDPANWRGDQLSVLESLPLRAWRSLGLPHLPAKRVATDGQIESHLQRLIGLGLIAESGPAPTHDQLQALVAGLGGLAVAGNAHNRYEAKGTKAFNLGAAWREGYIVSLVFNVQ
jgi:hypothetical protein